MVAVTVAVAVGVMVTVAVMVMAGVVVAVTVAVVVAVMVMAGVVVMVTVAVVVGAEVRSRTMDNVNFSVDNTREIWIATDKGEVYITRSQFRTIQKALDEQQLRERDIVISDLREKAERLGFVLKEKDTITAREQEEQADG